MISCKTQKSNENGDSLELSGKGVVEQLEQTVKYSESKSTQNNKSSAFDCSRTKYECCPDGETPANVSGFLIFEVYNYYLINLDEKQKQGTAFKDCPDDVSRLEIKFATPADGINYVQ